MTFHRVATARRARSQPCVGHASGQNGYSLTAHTVQASTCQHTSRAGPSPRRAQPRDGTAPRPRAGSPAPAHPCAAPAAPTARVASWRARATRPAPPRTRAPAASARLRRRPLHARRRSALHAPAPAVRPGCHTHAAAGRPGSGAGACRAKSSRRVRASGAESWADFQKMMVLQPRTAGSTSQPSRVNSNCTKERFSSTSQVPATSAVSGAPDGFGSDTN